MSSAIPRFCKIFGPNGPGFRPALIHCRGYGFPGGRERQARGQAGERQDGQQVPVVEVGDRDREHEQDDRGDPGQHAADAAGTREPDQA